MFRELKINIEKSNIYWTSVSKKRSKWKYLRIARTCSSRLIERFNDYISFFKSLCRTSKAQVCTRWNMVCS